MKNIEINNSKLSDKLYEWSDYILDINPAKLIFTHGIVNGNDYEYVVTENCLNSFKEDKFYPDDSFLFDFNYTVDKTDDFIPYYHDFVWHLTNIDNVVSSSERTLASIYPPDGFIGWHTNSNRPGYNIIFTFSETGNGFFRYKDPVSKEIITIQDKPGWTAKAGYFGNSSKDIFWHCAKNGKSGPRLTCSYVFNNIEDQEQFIDFIGEVNGNM